MNTWFSVHKNKKFLEEHDVLDMYLFYRTTKEEKVAKKHFLREIDYLIINMICSNEHNPFRHMKIGE